jgi:hypothetical protein
LIFVSASCRARSVFADLARRQTFRFLIFRLRPRLHPLAGTLALPGAVGTVSGDWSQAKPALDTAVTNARDKAAAASGVIAAPLVPWTLHDLLRTVATGLQRLGVRLEVTEAVLNHVSGSRGGIAGVYQRRDWAAERRSALDAWAAHMFAPNGGPHPPTSSCWRGPAEGGDAPRQLGLSTAAMVGKCFDLPCSQFHVIGIESLGRGKKTGQPPIVSRYPPKGCGVGHQQVIGRHVQHRANAQERLKIRLPRPAYVMPVSALCQACAPSHFRV